MLLYGHKEGTPPKRTLTTEQKEIAQQRLPYAANGRSRFYVAFQTGIAPGAQRKRGLSTVKGLESRKAGQEWPKTRPVCLTNQGTLAKFRVSVTAILHKHFFLGCPGMEGFHSAGQLPKQLTSKFAEADGSAGFY